MTNAVQGPVGQNSLPKEKLSPELARIQRVQQLVQRTLTGADEPMVEPPKRGIERKRRGSSLKHAESPAE